METRKTLDAVEAAALDVLTAVEWFRRLSSETFCSGANSDDGTDWEMLNEDLDKTVREATALLVASVKRLSELLDDADTQTAVRSANSEPVTLANTTADSVAEVVEALGYECLRTIAKEADRLLWTRSAIKAGRLFSLSADNVVAKWDAVREVVSNAPIDCNGLDVAVRKERARAERVAVVIPAADQDLDDGPPDALLAELSKQQRCMVEFVWNKPAVARHKFQAHVWKRTKVPEKKTVERQVQRLADRLIELKAGYEISINDEFVKFGRLSAK